MERLKLFAAFASGSFMMLFVMIVWLHCRMLPQAINYESKLIECEGELALVMIKSMNVSLRK